MDETEVKKIIDSAIPVSVGDYTRNMSTRRRKCYNKLLLLASAGIPAVHLSITRDQALLLINILLYKLAISRQNDITIADSVVTNNNPAITASNINNINNNAITAITKAITNTNGTTGYYYADPTKVLRCSLASCCRLLAGARIKPNPVVRVTDKYNRFWFINPDTPVTLVATSNENELESDE